MEDDIITLNTVTRKCAVALKGFIEADQFLSSYREKLEVIVEDKAEIETKIKTAISKATGGVAVLISIIGFQRRPNSGPILTGTLDIQISVHENPLFNRKGQFVLTAQCVAERLATILHWTKLDGFDNRILFDSFARADDNSANIEVVNFHTEQKLNGVLKE